MRRSACLSSERTWISVKLHKQAELALRWEQRQAGVKSGRVSVTERKSD